MKILVPIKRVADPDNANKVKIAPDGSRVDPGQLELKVNPFDEYAVEAALRLVENAATGQRSGEVVVASIGPKPVTTTMRAMLAMGADRGILVEADDEALDGEIVASALAALVAEEKPDVVLMGKQQVDGDSNQVGQILAQHLGWPQATFAMSISLEAGGKAATVGREVDGGVAWVKVQFPAVVTVDLRIVMPKAVVNGITPESHAYADTPRYASLKGIMAAKKKPIAEKTLASLGTETAPKVRYLGFVPPPARQAGVKVESVEELVAKLKGEAKVL